RSCAFRGRVVPARGRARAVLLRRLFALLPERLDFLFGKVLDADEGVFPLADADQFVELGLQGGAVAVLRVLDEEHHQEGDDGGAGVDDELPGIGEAEERAAYRPGHHDGAAGEKGEWRAGSVGGRVGGRGKYPLEAHADPARAVRRASARPACSAASLRFSRGRGPICWMTSPAASEP